MKIENLKREIKKKRNKILNCKEGEDKIFENILKSSKLDYDKIINKVSKKIIFEKKDTLKDMINSFYIFNIEIEEIPESQDYEYSLIKSVYYHRSKGMLENVTPIKVTIKDNDDSKNEFYSIKEDMLKKSATGGFSKKGKHRFIEIHDLYKMIAEVYVADIIYNFYTINHVLKDKAILNYIFTRGYITSEYLNNEDFRYMCNKYNLNIDELDIVVEKNTISKNFILELLSKEPFSKLEYLLQPNFKKNEISKIYLKQMFSELSMINWESKELENMNKEYAKSYQTKKNIPEKVLKKMNKNKFLNYFGSVELDELTDFNKLEIIENDFLDFTKQINSPIFKNHTFRIRRLGHHKAAGVYFPFAKSLCIDIMYPKALVHEYMHMLDYSLGNCDRLLNNQNSFIGIAYEYKKQVRNNIVNLPDNDNIKKDFFSKNKYNEDYYFNNKEIFARCGEIYIKKILNCDYSIVDNCNSVFYNCNEELLNKIKKFYNDIFQNIKRAEAPITNNYEKKEDIKGNKEITLKTIEVQDNIYQFSLF